MRGILFLIIASISVLAPLWTNTLGLILELVFVAIYYHTIRFDL